MDRRRGFTLIELLVVLGVTTLLASGAILYGSASRKQTMLYVETAKLSQAVLDAESQAVRTYYDPAVISCGYGIRIDRLARSYALFSYVVADASACNDITTVAESNYMEIARTTLAGGVVFLEAVSVIQDVLFLPPDPTTLLWDAEGLIGTDSAAIALGTDDGSAESRISINKRGQVSFQ